MLIDMGYAAIFKEINPFPFMDKLVLNEITKVNFLERLATQYQSPSDSRLIIDDSPL